MHNNDGIVHRIKEIMSEKGLNQSELGHDIGFPQANISLILKQQRGAMPLIEKLSAAYNISKEWLLTGLGTKYIKSEILANTDISELTKEERLSLVHELNDLQKRHQDLMSEAQGIMDRIVKINERLLFSVNFE